jgi:hypothetical protein
VVSTKTRGIDVHNRTAGFGQEQPIGRGTPVVQKAAIGSRKGQSVSVDKYGQPVIYMDSDRCARLGDDTFADECATLQRLELAKS